MSVHNLEKIFKPKSIAVISASEYELWLDLQKADLPSVGLWLSDKENRHN